MNVLKKKKILVISGFPHQIKFKILPENSVKPDCSFQHFTTLVRAVGTSTCVRRERQCDDEDSEIKGERNEMHEPNAQNRTSKRAKGEMGNDHDEERQHTL